MSKPRFHVKLKVKELSNIPQNTGQVYVKWYLKDTAKPDARGRTASEPIKDHRTSWYYEGETTVRVGIDRDHILRHSWIIFEVLWEQGSSKVPLGKVELNLAEYVNRDSDMNRYLLKESKINSILHIEIRLKQSKGPTNYRIPEFTSPQIFGDITGVMDEKKGRAGSKRHEDNLSSVLSDRHTFAVTWNAKPGDLTPEACIEDIFAGGDGFGDAPRSLPSIDSFESDKNSDRTTSTSSDHRRSRQAASSGAGSSSSQHGSTASTGQQLQDFSDEKRHPSARLLREVEERDGFQSWRVDVQRTVPS